MRLINVKTKKLEEFFGFPVAYAILSHCWGKQEVTFQDINQSNWQDKASQIKIKYVCSQAQKDNLQYVWIDT
jgi:hypothetical protein